MKKIFIYMLSFFMLFGLTACDKHKSIQTIKVGTIDGPGTQLMEVARKVALKRYGLRIKIIAFSDYNSPNAALNNHTINANAFQSMPFLREQIKNRGYNLAVVGETFIYPMGIYSRTLTNLNQLPDGAKVGIPREYSNEIRALRLLEKAGLITLKANAGEEATIADVLTNPKNLKLIEFEAWELPKGLPKLAIATINTDFAVHAGLSPEKDALFHEGADSPYINVVVVHADDVNDPRFKQLVEALHSDEVREKAKKLFGNGAIPVFK